MVRLEMGRMANRKHPVLLKEVALELLSQPSQQAPHLETRRKGICHRLPVRRGQEHRTQVLVQVRTGLRTSLAPLLYLIDHHTLFQADPMCPFPATLVLSDSGSLGDMTVVIPEIHANLGQEILGSLVIREMFGRIENPEMFARIGNIVTSVSRGIRDHLKQLGQSGPATILSAEDKTILASLPDQTYLLAVTVTSTNENVVKAAGVGGFTNMTDLMTRQPLYPCQHRLWFLKLQSLL